MDYVDYGHSSFLVSWFRCTSFSYKERGVTFVTFLKSKKVSLKPLYKKGFFIVTPLYRGKTKKYFFPLNFGVTNVTNVTLMF